MKHIIIAAAVLLSIFSTLSTAVPLYEEQLLNEIEEPIIIRERRSPQQQQPPQQNLPAPGRGNFNIQAQHSSGQGGFAKGEYNHNIWHGKNGARLDGNAYYQRNWGQPGRREDFGGGVKLTVPIGGRRH
ncbi:uncharacterized protein LOC142321987 [Lycorma delicatula]|uniref:uncharacterized protein LOC142321987 n=1 Tax=Lycorma delicatula TaxID=130591 RepID=UPI003F50F092